MGIPCKMNQDQNSMGFFCKVFCWRLPINLQGNWEYLLQLEINKERKEEQKKRKKNERKKRKNGRRAVNE